MLLSEERMGPSYPGEGVLVRVAGIMAESLGWTKDRIEREIETVNGNYQCLADL
jgi:hypothetical protein